MQILHMDSLILNIPSFELKVALETMLLIYLFVLCSCSLKKLHGQLLLLHITFLMAMMQTEQLPC